MKEAPSVWTDMTWWVHFQKLNLGLVCQNGLRCWEQLNCSVAMKRNPSLKNQPKPNQSRSKCVSRCETENHHSKSPTAFRMSFPQGSEVTRFVHHSSPWVCSFRFALYRRLPNKKAACVCNTNASVNGWKDQKSYKWETFCRLIMPWCTDFTLENEVIN